MRLPWRREKPKETSAADQREFDEMNRENENYLQGLQNLAEQLGKTDAPRESTLHALRSISHLGGGTVRSRSWLFNDAYHGPYLRDAAKQIDLLLTLDDKEIRQAAAEAMASLVYAFDSVAGGKRREYSEKSSEEIIAMANQQKEGDSENSKNEISPAIPAVPTPIVQDELLAPNHTLSSAPVIAEDETTEHKLDLPPAAENKASRSDGYDRVPRKK